MVVFLEFGVLVVYQTVTFRRQYTFGVLQHHFGLLIAQHVQSFCDADGRLTPAARTLRHIGFLPSTADVIPVINRDRHALFGVVDFAQRKSQYSSRVVGLGKLRRLRSECRFFSRKFSGGLSSSFHVPAVIRIRNPTKTPSYKIDYV